MTLSAMGSRNSVSISVAGIALVLSLSRHSADGAKLSCGQTNECIWIAGTLELQSPLVAPSSVQRRRFEILSDGSLWRTRIYDPSISTNALFAFWEHGTDGESVYEVVVYNTNYVGELIRRKKDGRFETNFGAFRSTNTASATVTDGIVPAPSASYVQFVWLAFLSGCYFEQRDSPADIPPLFSVNPEAMLHGYKAPARWLLSDDFPFTLVELTFFGTSYFVSGPGKPVVRKEASFPYTNLFLRTETATNNGHWVFPQTFSIISFFPPGSDGTAPLKIAFTCRGEMTELRRVPWTEDFLPIVPRSTAVADRRDLGGSEVASYFTSKQWLSRDEAREAARDFYSVVVEKGKRQRGRTNALSFFIVLSLMFITIAAWVLRQRVFSGRRTIKQ